MNLSLTRARRGSFPFAAVLPLGILAAAAGLLACQSVPAIPTGKLDHFLVYEVVRVEAAHDVRLSDQFHLPLTAATLGHQTHFANPARKLHPGGSAGIVDTNHHLSWYTAQQPQPHRWVRFRNQFGQHSVNLRDSAFLLVPTEKTSHSASEFPRDLDHYRCYRVIDVPLAPALPVVQVGDQFGTVSGLQVGPPVLFCNPVRKVREGEPPVGVQNADDHLAVYSLPPQDVQEAIEVRDQFGQRELRVRRMVFLAVPTHKQTFGTHAN